ncbi:hypothetical protein I302_104145 [Kwoniella bestiolae CBS 10118]|uniref:Uncharacterized protein n=1 Tax=Kwoniella bestiolae CBS 10118 TaxID=1296100 RepID=A0AAJ8M8Y9_9TREE
MPQKARKSFHGANYKERKSPLRAISLDSSSSSEASRQVEEVGSTLQDLFSPDSPPPSPRTQMNVALGHTGRSDMLPCHV